MSDCQVRLSGHAFNYSMSTQESAPVSVCQARCLRRFIRHSSKGPPVLNQEPRNNRAFWPCSVDQVHRHLEDCRISCECTLHKPGRSSAKRRHYCSSIDRRLFPMFCHAPSSAGIRALSVHLVSATKADHSKVSHWLPQAVKPAAAFCSSEAGPVNEHAAHRTVHTLRAL
jgi:hypothetical protein